MQVYDRLSYTAFLVPGLVMMAMLQNAFANSSSSLIQSKITGNIVFMLLAPLSHVEFFGAYVVASVVRGLAVGVGVLAVTLWFVGVPVAHPLWARGIRARRRAILGALGLLAGIWAEKIDQLAAFQNFVIMPLTFLSGVFYSIHSLPPFWQRAVAREPVLLHDRRLPLRLLRRVGRRIRSPASRSSGCSWPASRRLHSRLLKAGYRLRH